MHGCIQPMTIQPLIYITEETAGETYQWQWKVIDHAGYKKY